jgi:hypothetical protein
LKKWDYWLKKWDYEKEKEEAGRKRREEVVAEGGGMHNPQLEEDLHCELMMSMMNVIKIMMN